MNVITCNLIYWECVLATVEKYTASRIADTIGLTNLPVLWRPKHGSDSLLVVATIMPDWLLKFTIRYRLSVYTEWR